MLPCSVKQSQLLLCSVPTLYLLVLTQIPATVPKPFNFALDSRLKQRRDFNEDLKKRQRAAEERDRIAQEQREREEAQELKKYRKTLDFKVRFPRASLCQFHILSVEGLSIPYTVSSV